MTEIEGATSNHGPLQKALTEFELSGRATNRGSPLDTIARIAAGGDTLAINELVRIVKEMKIAEHPVRSVLLDPADVDDAIQTTLIILTEKIGSFEQASSFKTWVGAIARNEALQVVRRRQRKTEPETNEIPEYDQTAQRLSSLVASEQLYDQAISSLSKEHQRILKLREELNLTYDDISEQLQIPVGTVRSRISRARLLLAEQLTSTDPDR